MKVDRVITRIVFKVNVGRPPRFLSQKRISVQTSYKFAEYAK
jgi:hypothetical protein